MIGVVLGFGAITSVLAFGGVEILAFAPAQIAVAMLATAVFWQRGFPAISRTTAWILAILLGIPLLQLIPLPPSVVASLSPARTTVMENLAGVGTSVPQTVALTVSAYETQLALLRFTCYILVFLLAFELYRLRGEPNALVGVLVGIGVFEAVYGSVQYLTGWQYIFAYRRLYYTEDATGTYINRNHFAGLLEMVLPFLLAGILLRNRKFGTSGRSPWVELLVSPLSSRLLRNLVVLALICVGLVFSRSRMGITAGVVGILVVATVAFLRSRSKSLLVILPLILLLPAAYSVWIGITPVIGRFEVLTRSGALEQDRLPVWRDAVAVIRDYPLFGTGLGTYRLANGHYQSSMLSWVIEHAHNDYLEFAADIGIPGALLLFTCLWALVIRVSRKALELEHFQDRTVAAGCAGAMTAILVHSITDFNLQMPANAYLFCWIAGTASALTTKRSHAPSG